MNRIVGTHLNMHPLANITEMPQCHTLRTSVRSISGGLLNSIFFKIHLQMYFSDTCSAFPVALRCLELTSVFKLMTFLQKDSLFWMKSEEQGK